MILRANKSEICQASEWARNSAKVNCNLDAEFLPAFALKTFN